MLPVQSWLLLLAAVVIPLAIVLKFYFAQHRREIQTRSQKENS